MANHSSTFAWKIPWTEEHGGLQSMAAKFQAQLSNSHTHTQTNIKGASPVAQWSRIHLQFSSHRRCEFDPWVGEIPWRRAWQITSVDPFLENPMNRGAWQATGHGGHKESDMTEVTSHAHTQYKRDATESQLKKKKKPTTLAPCVSMEIRH